MFCLRTKIFEVLLKPSRHVNLPIMYLLPQRHKYNIEKLKHVPVQPDEYENRNEKLKRALSPHLTIYKFEMPAQQSIAHRTSGIILSTYLVALGVGALVLPQDFAFYIGVIDSWDLNSHLLTFGKFLFALPFTIHFIGGVKHLVWDIAPMLLKNMNHIFIAGHLVFGLGVMFAALLALIKTKRCF